MVAEYLHGITFLAVDVRHIYHAHIHADVAHIVCLLPIDKTVAAPVAQMAVQTIGITYWNGSNAAVTVKHRTARVADAVALGHIANLKDGRLESRHII